MSKIYMETNESLFLSKCKNHLDSLYDKDAARFDPIDMSKQIESSVMCTSLFNLMKTLQDHSKNGLADAIRYSYILTLQTYIETNEASDYGRCEEQAASKPTFCLEFFQWTPDFSIWSLD